MKYALVVLLLVTAFLRFWQLAEVPAGFYVDEASQGYNAYALLKTGKDEYAQAWPVFIRSFSTFTSPLYTYFSIPVIFFAGLTVWSVRFISALSGVGIVILSYLVCKQFSDRLSGAAALAISAVVAVSPWGVLFSRGVLEPNLGLFLFLLGFYCYLLSKKKSFLLLVSLFSFGLATYAYSAYRVIVLLFIIALFVIERKHLFEHKKALLASVLLLVTLEIPLAIFSLTPAASKRLADLDYTGAIFSKYSASNPVTKFIRGSADFGYEFTSKYLAYYSPRSLFFEPDPDLGKSLPDSSVFYSWMVVPFLIGIYVLANKKKSKIDVLLVVLLVIAPIPASLTRDPFATVRAPLALWVVSTVIGIGLSQLYSLFPRKILRITLVGAAITVSGLLLYRNYFVLLNFDRASAWSFGLKQLAQKFGPEDQVVVDHFRLPAMYANFLFFWKYPPDVYQKTNQVRDYYSDTAFYENRQIGNVAFRKLSWKTDLCKDQILVGDNLLFSGEQITAHYLTPFFEVKDPKGNILYRGFRTNPTLSCSPEL